MIHMAAGSLGETAGCLIRVPVEVVKQRAQAKHFKSSKDAFMNIVRSNNGLQFIREMYRGAGITLLREIPFTMIQFPLWEALKVWHVSRNRVPGGLDVEARENIGAVPSALYGSFAGAVGAALTTPLDVLKTRLMLSRERVGAIVMLKQIIRESGPKTLLAGIGPRVGWISVGGAVFLGSYQWASNRMEEAHRKKDIIII
jgi:solute carrier family 25 S-adenosylmethionine transporter 26